MNIFIVNNHPAIAATHLHNRHITKMVLESAQLLSTAHRFLGNDDERLYSKTHVNHPCSIWLSFVHVSMTLILHLTMVQNQSLFMQRL